MGRARTPHSFTFPQTGRNLGVALDDRMRDHSGAVWPLTRQPAPARVYSVVIADGSSAAGDRTMRTTLAAALVVLAASAAGARAQEPVAPPVADEQENQPGQPREHIQVLQHPYEISS